MHPARRSTRKRATPLAFVFILFFFLPIHRRKGRHWTSLLVIGGRFLARQWRDSWYRGRRYASSVYPILASLLQEGLRVLWSRKSTPGDNHGHHGVCIHGIRNKVEIILILGDGFDRSPGSCSLAQVRLLSNAFWNDADDVL